MSYSMLPRVLLLAAMLAVPLFGAVQDHSGTETSSPMSGRPSADVTDSVRLADRIKARLFGESAANALPEDAGLSEEDEEAGAIFDKARQDGDLTVPVVDTPALLADGQDEVSKKLDAIEKTAGNVAGRAHKQVDDGLKEMEKKATTQQDVIAKLADRAAKLPDGNPRKAALQKALDGYTDILARMKKSTIPGAAKLNDGAREKAIAAQKLAAAARKEIAAGNDAKASTLMRQAADKLGDAGEDGLDAIANLRVISATHEVIAGAARRIEEELP